MSTLSRTTKILGGGLILSLGLNLFLAGLIAGKLFRDRSRLGEAQPLATVSRTMEWLPAKDRRQIEKAMKVRRAAIARDFRNMRRARSRVVRIISENKYNEQELEEALRKVRQIQEKTQAAFHEVIVEVIPKLPPEERRRFLLRLGNRSHREGPRPPSHRR